MAETRHNSREKKKTSKLVPILIITPLLLTVIIASVFFVYYEQSKNVDDNEVVAKINGFEITAKELAARMAIDKKSVVDKFGKDYKDELNEDFWDLEVKDDNNKNTNPREYLQNMALEEIVKYKVQLQIALDNGILSKDEATYDAFVKGYQTANKGKKKISEKKYYEKYYNELSEKNRVALSENGKPLYVDDENLRNWFDEVKGKAYKKIDSFSFDIYYANYDDASNNLNKDSAKAIIKNAKNAIKDGNSLSFVKNNISKFVFKQTMDINYKTATEKQKNFPSFYKEAVNLEAGDFSKVYLGVRPQHNVKVAFFGVCKSRKSGGYLDFESVKSTIFKNYTNEKYEKYVESKVKAAKVKKLEKFSKVTGLD